MTHPYPFHFQSAVHDCVPTCVLSLSEYYGVSVTLKQLRKTLVTDPYHGTPIKNLLHLQGTFQITLGKIVNLEEISNYFPFVAYLNRAHAVVVWAFTEDGSKLIVGDPGIGIMEVANEDFLRQWDGLTAVIRPLEGQTQKIVSHRNQTSWSWSRFYKDLFGFLNVKWNSMLWISLVISLLGILNSFYSLNYAKYLQTFWPFILFVSGFTVVSAILNWFGNYLQSKLTLKYSELVGWKIRDAFPQIDQKFYTIGDISTRYQDAAIVINAIMGVFRDVPYSLMIFGASLYFLCRIHWLLGVFVLAFLVLIIAVLSPFVLKVQNLNYTIKIRESEMMNKLQQYVMGAAEEVTSAWEEKNVTIYKQSLWSIPISSVVSNSSVFPVLFVVIFLYWRSGGISQYQDILSGIMIMSFAVQAGHTLYGRYVAWQTALPSFHRLKDFIEIDQEYAEEAEVS